MGTSNHRYFYQRPTAIAIKDRQSATIAIAIWTHWVCIKSVPLKVISDKAREFISKGIKQLGHKLGSKMITTSGYNPTGNSSVERFHRYMNAALAIVYEKIRADWDDYIPAVLFSYRASINDATGYSPFFLEHGRDPQLPINNLFPYLRHGEEKEENFVTKIVEKLEFAFGEARNISGSWRRRIRKTDPRDISQTLSRGTISYYKHGQQEREG